MNTTTETVILLVVIAGASVYRLKTIGFTEKNIGATLAIASMLLSGWTLWLTYVVLKVNKL